MLLELVPGINLSEYLHIRRYVSEGEALYFVKQIVRGIRSEIVENFFGINISAHFRRTFLIVI
jgi:hypothetical protein